MIGEAASKGISQLSEQVLLLFHSHQLVMAYGRNIFKNHIGTSRLGNGLVI